MVFVTHNQENISCIFFRLLQFLQIVPIRWEIYRGNLWFNDLKRKNAVARSCGKTSKYFSNPNHVNLKKMKIRQRKNQVLLVYKILPKLSMSTIVYLCTSFVQNTLEKWETGS